MKFKGLLVIAALALLCAGCTQIVTHSLPQAKMQAYKRVFVEHRHADSYGVGEEMARQLRDMGYEATTGALTMMPPDTEIVVSYEDMWTWDFNTYMIAIDVQVRQARSDKVLAVGHYYRPTAVLGHTPSTMIHDLLSKLFKSS